MKKILLFLMTFGLIFVRHVVSVNAYDDWIYYEESPFSVPPTDNFYVDNWVNGLNYGVEGFWNFAIPFELEHNVSLDSIKVRALENLFIEVYLQTYGGGGYDDWLQIDAYDYFDDMDVNCEMILYGETDEWIIDVSNKAYQLMTTGYEFKNIDLLYPPEKMVYRVDFVFEIDFHIDLTGLGFDEITNVYHQYQLDLYYNPSVYYDAYEKGLEDGYDSGYDDGYDDGYEFGQTPETRGFSAMLVALWNAISGFLGITLFWDITIGAIILIPIVFGLISFILGKRGD